MDIPTLPPHGGRSSSAARFLDLIHRYKRLLVSHWWVLCLTTSLAFGVGWIVLKHQPPNFVSTGRMTLSVKLAIPNASYYSDDVFNFFGTQVELMESSTVQKSVYQRLR